ncbi:MAG: sugar transferase [Verrucomicrobiales bacterium]|nr:sugar transferase [Verrucomicrobiales bacterium]
MVKRLFDVAFVLVTAPAWLPLLVVVGLVVRLRLGRPVLFRQARPGRYGRPFQLLKFRTMADTRDGTGTPLPDAQRLTAFGCWLRASSLDELPEVINILRGEMSLVGPRPLLMQYLGRYTAEQARRHEVRPGLTGWAQVRGRNAITWEERFALDLWYVQHQTVWLDLRILGLTILKVLKREGVSAPGEATMPEFMGAKTTQGCPPQDR